MVIAPDIAPTPQRTLQAAAERHLWPQFTALSEFVSGRIPVIVRGEGCWVYDENGRRFFDGLSGLYTTMAGHGRAELADAAARQAREMAYFNIWTFAHPRSIELAERLAALAPGDLNRVFFTTSGSEAVESAWKLARQYFKTIGKPGKHKVISRNLAYHGTTMGALSITSLPSIKSDFEPLVPSAIKVPNTNFYRASVHADDETAFGRWAAEQIAVAIEAEGADTVAAVFLEPVQNSGGCFTPPPGYLERVREICDEYDVLLVSDEVICGFGRLGEWFSADRYGVLPDMITMAKGLTSGYAPMGGVLVSDRVVEPFQRPGAMFLHGSTWAGHPVSAAVALANLDLLERDDLLGNVRANEAYFRGLLESLRDIPIVGDVRGAGYFLAVELVRDQSTKETFTPDECERLLRGYLSPAFFERGLFCRADDRGDPVVQLSPPLIAGPEELDFVGGVLRDVLSQAAGQL